MYARKGITYADPGKLLRLDNRVAYQLPSDEGVTEFDAPADDIHRIGEHAVWGDGYCIQTIKPGKDYGYYKERLIKRRYSNDDQIAIILNRDADEDGQLQYDRMQQWRDWAGEVAKKIVTLT